MVPGSDLGSEPWFFDGDFPMCRLEMIPGDLIPGCLVMTLKLYDDI